MRLLFATSIRTWGGGEEWMLAAATGLRARGHDAALVARPASAIATRARDAGLDVVAAAFASDADVLSFLRVLRACRARRVEAAVVNMDRVLRVAGCAARLAGVGVVLPRRGSEFPLKPGPVYRWTYTRVATGVIVNSRATGRTLLRDVPWRPAGRVHVLPNGIDADRFARARSRGDVRRALDLPPDAAVLLTVGELTDRKNPTLVVEAAARLAARGLAARILFAGEGPERAAVERRARELGLPDRVHLLGFRDDVPDLLAACDVLVHPSRVEGFGYAVAEAMAAGRPVVATAASSLPEIVADGRTGILFPPDDADALADALAVYLGDPGRRARDGQRGRERVLAEFSRERRLDELESLLEAEIARAASRARPRR